MELEMTEEIESMKYQEMLSDVENIIGDISSDHVDLDIMVEKVEKGYHLIKEMKKRLDDTKMKISKLQLEFSGTEEQGEVSS